MQYDKVEERLLMFPNSTLELSHLVIVDNKKRKVGRVYPFIPNMALVMSHS